MSRAIAERYEIADEIGAGGMGTVYRGVDKRTDQPVAVKHLKPQLVASNPGMIDRFVREGEALRQLNHPNIVKILDALQVGNDHYLVMEYVSGGSLADLLRHEQALSVSHTLEIALELADALTRAHHLKIIHRDIKPANVLIAADGTPRLTDFGVAHMGKAERITDSGTAIGTIHYLSPEALLGDEVDTRADLWAFGVMLFEMLVGKLPFEGDNWGAIVTSILMQPVPDLETLHPDIPIALTDLIYRMLEKDRQARIPSARLVGAELEAIIQGRDTPSTGSRVGASLVQPSFDTPTPTPDTVKSNLPPQNTPFVGREEEIAELVKLLDHTNTRLVAILAPGGMGKTRLALEVGTQLIERVGAQHAAPLQWSSFSDGIYFVGLAPLTSPDSIITAIADAVGFPFNQGGEPKQQLLDYFREKHLLLLTDNFEHVLDGADIVGDILAYAPGVKVLATSRERLNIGGETIFALSGMDFPDWETPENALEYAAVKLFMQSARRVRPDFALAADNLKYLARICRLVAGMPLAIVLAAVWVEMLSLKEIASEIEQSLDFLETEQRDMPERQRSIRGVFEYAWNRLSDDERAVFARLAAFRGGFTREAAQTVAGASLKTLAALVNKSLLRRDPDTGRYEVHELLRQYGERELERAGEREAAYDAHCGYFADFMYERIPDIKGRRQLAALDETEADFENVRAAWEYAYQHQNYAALDQMLESLYWFCDMRGRFVEITALLQSARAAVNPDAGAEARRVWGRLSSYLARTHVIGNLETADDIEALVENGLTEAQSFGKRSEIAFALFTQGIYVFFGDNTSPVALQLFADTLQLYRQLDDPYYIADLLLWHGSHYLFENQPETALRLYGEGVAMKRQIGDKSGVAWGLWNISFMEFRHGHMEDANRYVEESLALMREKRDTKGIDWMTGMHRWTTFWLGAFDRSAAFHEEVFGRTFATTNMTIKTGEVISKGLTLCVLLEDYTRSIPLLEEGFASGQKTNAAQFIVESALGLSLALFAMGDYAGADLHFRTALKIRWLARNYLPMILGIAALLTAHKGKRASAVEFLALFQTHPDIVVGWRSWPLINRLQAQLQAELPPDVYAAAWERGQARDLTATISELQAEGNS